MGFYRSKPESIVAVQWTGDNWDELKAHGGDNVRMTGTGRVDFRVPGTGGWRRLSERSWLATADGGLTLFRIWPEIFAERYEVEIRYAPSEPLSWRYRPPVDAEAS